MAVPHGLAGEERRRWRDPRHQPGRLGIGVFSPRLDPHGNSVRGIAVCRARGRSRSASLRRGPAARAGSALGDDASQSRLEAASAGCGRAPAQSRKAAALVPPAGPLAFAADRAGGTRDDGARGRHRLLHPQSGDGAGVDPAATRLLAGTRRELRGLGKLLIFSEASTWWQLLIDAGIEREAIFTDDDFALEYGENLLLAERFRDVAWEAQTRLRNARCSPASQRGARGARAAARHPILSARADDRGGRAELGRAFVITRGSAMVSIPTQNGVSRLDSFTSGMTFGDVAFIDRSPRSANVTALGPVECRVLTREALPAWTRKPR